LCGEEGGEVCLPTISTVWECAYINYKDVNGKEGWECQWCGLSFKPSRQATRAMRHVLKMKGGDIAICKAVISARYRDRYQAFYDRQFPRVDSKRLCDRAAGGCSSESLGYAQAARGKWSSLITSQFFFFPCCICFRWSWEEFIFHFFAGSAVSVNNASVGHSEEQRCHSGNGNRRLLSLQEYPRCSGGIISIQATDKCVSSSWRQVCSSECK